ncbi:hypothetical protein GGR51DRAFT_496427 [Nemania sp. FL0031]|nr:hypothetical protein GGR51DRAFT_496427 [Nemania sp. FL0031]
MADEDLVQKVRELGDIDLAALLCLISREHCIISTDAEYLDELTLELQLVADRTFGLRSVVVDCTPETTLDDLITSIQLPPPQQQQTQAQAPLRSISVPHTPSPLHTRGSDSYFSTHHSSGNAGTHSHQYHQHSPLRPLPSLSPSANTTPASPSKTPLPSTAAPHRQIANVILARNLDVAPKAVQIQCLELMRTRRIFTRTNVQACPKQFLLIAVLGSESAGTARLTKHLNDHFYISHWQDPEDGFPHFYKEEDRKENEAFHVNNNIDGDGRGEEGDDDDDTASQASSASVVRRTRSSKTPSTAIPTPTLGPGPGQQTSTTDWAIPSPGNPQPADNHHTNTNTNSNSNSNSHSSAGRSQLFTETDISTLSTLGLQAHVDIEVQRYQMNIVAFLRLHRAVTPGSVPPSATTHFRTLVRALAALHGLDFVTPELVQLAARKIYVHHIMIVPAERERSMQWGSDLAAVRALLEDVQPEDVVEDVLGTVNVPL